jgi:hypothetical protein
MYEPFVRSDYYRASVPSRAFNRRRVYPTNPNGSRAAGTMRDGSRVHREPIDQLGTQLCPGSIANGYAAALHRGLPTSTLSQLRSQPSTLDGRALHPGPYPPDLSRCLAYGALPLVPVVYPLISLAGPNPSGSIRLSRLCQRCFPPSPASPGSGCAPLLPGYCNSPAKGIAPPSTPSASRRTGASWRRQVPAQRHQDCILRKPESSKARSWC